MKNAIFWDIKTQFLPHRRHVTLTIAVYLDIKTQFVPHRKYITSLQQSPGG
jgi:hypothetical protein